jgi:hypothetical protein
MRRSGPKTLDRQANLGDLGVKRHSTWGMSVFIAACKKNRKQKTGTV